MNPVVFGRNCFDFLNPCLRASFKWVFNPKGDPDFLFGVYSSTSFRFFVPPNERGLYDYFIVIFRVACPIFPMEQLEDYTTFQGCISYIPNGVQLYKQVPKHPDNQPQFIHSGVFSGLVGNQHFLRGKNHPLY